MTLAVSLSEASYLSYEQCNIRRLAGTLQVNLQTFRAAALAIPGIADDIPEGREIANWLIPMSSAMNVLPTPGTPQQVEQLAEYLFRMYSLAAYMTANALISGATSAALLAAWNASIGT